MIACIDNIMPAYNRMKVNELRELCEERGIDTAMCNKRRLIAALRQSDRQNEDEPVPAAEGSLDGEIELGARSFAHAVNTEVGERVYARGDVAHESESVRALQLKLALIQAERDRDREQREAREREWEIERERWQMHGTGNVSAVNNGVANGALNMKEIKLLLPTMSNNNPVSFFVAFERVMQLNNVHKQLWAKFLPAQLSANALQTFSRMSLEESQDYEVIKGRILASFNLGPQSYLRAFRTMKRNGSANYVIHLHNMKEVFRRFIDAARITSFESFLMKC